MRKQARLLRRGPFRGLDHRTFRYSTIRTFRYSTDRERERERRGPVGAHHSDGEAR